MESKKKNTIFLSPDEAVEAIRMDLEQYPLQPILLRRLAHLVLGEDRVVSEDARRGGMWVKTFGRRKPRLVDYGELAGFLLDELEIRKPPLKILAAVCGCVFQEKTGVARQSPGGEEGVVVETGAEFFECRQCGRCCQELDYRKELTDEDYRLWEKLGRIDILERVKTLRKKGEIVGYRIWMDPDTKETAEGCPWLKKDPERNRCVCVIHDVRPGICRQYPGSRKHARMTGCRGFESKCG